jgi:hemimethylated DNA binding protein
MAEFTSSCMRVVVRQPQVLFRLGQVVRHKLYRYRGVVIEWDPRANVEEQWIHQMGVR